MRVAFLPVLLVFVCPVLAEAAGPPAFPPWMGTGLFRSLDDKERAYLGQPLVDVVAAMDKVAQAKGGHCVAELSSGEQADPARPAMWVRDQGRLTPVGVTPASWEVPVVCPGFRAVISLSATTLTVVPEPGEKPVGYGPDVFATPGQLVIGDFVVATTRTPPKEEHPRLSSDSWANSPALALPVAIMIRAAKNPDIADDIDLDAARAALTRQTAMARSQPAVETDTQQGDDKVRQQTEDSVLAYLAGRNGPRKSVAIMATTWRGGLPFEAEAVLPGIAPEILPSAITDYREKNRISRSIPSNLAVSGAAVNLVDEATLRTFFAHGNTAAGWKKFAARFGDTQLYTFSRVGLSRDMSQAVVFEGYQGPRVGLGSLLFLRQEGASWRIMYQLRLWVESTERSYRVDGNNSYVSKDVPAPNVTPPARTPPPASATEPVATKEPEAAAKEPVLATKEPEKAPPAAVEQPAEPPKKSLGHVKVRFINDVALFKFEAAEFFLNGESIHAPLKTAANTAVDIWEGDVPTGTALLRVQARYLGKAMPPFYYLESMPFERELVRTFPVDREANHVLTVRASAVREVTQAMENTLTLDLVEGTTGGVPKVARLRPSEPEPKVGLSYIKVRFVNDVDAFAFEKAEFFLDGDAAGPGLKKVSDHRGSTVEVWEGTIPAGASVLRAHVRYKGKPFFPFYYLESIPVTREHVMNFNAKRDTQLTLTVRASQDPGLTKAMEDTLNVDVKTEVAAR